MKIGKLYKSLIYQPKDGVDQGDIVVPIEQVPSPWSTHDRYRILLPTGKTTIITVRKTLIVFQEL